MINPPQVVFSAPSPFMPDDFVPPNLGYSPRPSTAISQRELAAKPKERPKVVQISTSAVSRGCHVKHLVAALCADGTVWVHESDEYQRGWVQLPPV